MAVIDELREWFRYRSTIGNGSARYIKKGNLEPELAYIDPFDYLGGSKPLTTPIRRDPLSNRAFLRVKLSPRDEQLLHRKIQMLKSPGTQEEYSIEVIIRERSIRIQLAVSESDRASVQAQFRALFPNAEIYEADDILRQCRDNIRYVGSHRLKNSYLLPIDVRPDSDPYRVLSGVASRLEGEGTVVIQLRITAAVQDWSDYIRTSLPPWLSSSTGIHGLPDMRKHAGVKLEGHPFFSAAFAIGASSKKEAYEVENLLLPQFEGHLNGFTTLSESVNDFLERKNDRPGMLLNVNEASLITPLMDIADMDRRHFDVARFGAPPPHSYVERPLIALGFNSYQGTATNTGLMTEEEASKPVLIAGGTGSGKSTTLRQIETELANSGMLYVKICSKEEDFRSSLDIVPEFRKDEVVALDFAHPYLVPGFNLLHSSNERDRDQLASDTIVIIRRLSQHWGGLMEPILLNGIRTMLSSPEEKTLRDLYQFLTNEQYMSEVLNKIEEPDLLEFWREEYPGISRHARQPSLNVLNRFLSRTRVRNILCQPNLIDFQRIIREKRILIINLDKGKLGEDVSILLGMAILSRLQLAAVSRQMED